MSENRTAQAAADQSLPASNTFCTYLARQFIAKRGFSVGAVPEASDLAAHCDILLSFSDGHSLVILCMIDREAHPGKAFSLPPQTVEEIGKACLAHTAAVFGNKVPVRIHVLEVGPPDEGQVQRLSQYREPGWFAKVLPSGWICDPGARMVWTNARFGGRLYGANFIRKVMQSPREAESSLQPRIVAAQTAPVIPWLTIALIAVLTAIFAAELTFGIGRWTNLLEPTVTTLIAFGGLLRSLVFQHGEWTRLFSAPLLHADAGHLALNAIVLYLAGRRLEGLIGRAWLAAVFTIGAFGGAVFSLLLNPDTLVAVGVSGAAMALFATLFVLSFHFPHGADRTGLQLASVYVLLPSLLPFASAGKGMQIDYAGHFGGALAGLAMGLVLLAVWPRDKVRPDFGKAAAVVAVIGLAAFAYSFTPIAKNYQIGLMTAALIPETETPKTREIWNSQSAELTARYPRDPRPYMFRGLTLWGNQDNAGAERELRTALAEEDLWRTLLDPKLAPTLRTLLAVVISDTRMDEARKVAQQPCATEKSGDLRILLDQHKLCGA
jgi:rhomboid protease GluP